MTLTIWQVRGYYRNDRRRDVWMLIEAPEPPCSVDRESHFDIASRIAGPEFICTTAENVGTVPWGYQKNVLLARPACDGRPPVGAAPKRKRYRRPRDASRIARAQVE
jgi:hypothetical protein